MEQHISLEAVINFLVDTPLFQELDATERGEVARIMEVQRLDDGESVFREGTEGDAWYAVFAGHARVLKNLPAGPSEIARLGPGACFGEMAILDGMPRSASVVADGPLTIFRFRRGRFDVLLDEGSLGAYKLVVAMARTLSQRQRQLTQQITDLMAEKATSSVHQLGDVVNLYTVSE